MRSDKPSKKAPPAKAFMLPDMQTELYRGIVSVTDCTGAVPSIPEGCTENEEFQSLCRTSPLPERKPRKKK